MLSDVVALILASEGCCTIDELGEALSRSLVSAHPTHDALLAVLGDGDLFEPCAVGSEAWSLTDHCPHRSHAIPADASLDLEGFPSMFGWQREALEAWHAAGSRGLIEAVYGCEHGGYRSLWIVARPLQPLSELCIRSATLE